MLILKVEMSGQRELGVYYEQSMFSHIIVQQAHLQLAASRQGFVLYISHAESW